MLLKRYQQATLDTLREFFEASTIAGPKQAYTAMTALPDLRERLGRYAGPYRELNGLADTPYVCLRLPTGGGKTILATHAIEVARRAWLGKEFPLVLWLTPSNTIRTQTVEALKNPRHPYRKELDDQYGGAVRIFDIGDFTQVLPQDLATKCCVVVGTIQTLRVSNTDGRKVYAHHEMLEPHFSRLNLGGFPDLEPISESDSRPRFSFANLLHIHRPLMIVDEAQNAVSGLSQEMQARVNPAAIIEFTATPRLQSNILYSVSAQELKDEEMIKLPIRLSEHGSWREAVFGAVQNRAMLEEIAAKDADYIRPIVLFQAQNRDQDVTVDVLKAHLIDDLKIDPREIAVVTGDTRDLDGIDLMRADSVIRYVITVQALKEGWDCPFAYVFCSVANVSSAEDVEQLLGRVLRMPYARRRKQPELNRAYANVTSQEFAKAANALKDRLVNMGFSAEEIEETIEAQPELDAELFGPRARVQPRKAIAVGAISNEDVKNIREAAPEVASITLAPSGEAVVELTGVPSAAQLKALLKALPAAARKGFEETASAFAHQNATRVSPAQQGSRFIVPALMANLQGELQLVDPETYVDFADFNLDALSPQLNAGEFDIRSTADVFEIDVNGEKLTYSAIARERQGVLDGVEIDGLSHEQIVSWLARSLKDPQFGHGELVTWVSRTVSHLTGPRALTLTALNRCMFPLLRALQRRLADFKRLAVEGVYQTALFARGARPSLSIEEGFEFRHGMFSGSRLYQGAYQFQRHFLGPDRVPAFDGALDGEEFRCAQALDSQPAVRHWVRNVARHSDAFRLPLAGGWFYPDFVAELTDGRVAAIEYKGEAYASNDDSRDKRAVGQLWQDVSNHRAVFAFIERLVDGRDVRAQLEQALSVR